MSNLLRRSFGALRLSLIAKGMLIAACLCGSLEAQEISVIVRVKTKPEDSALVGQRIDFEVDVLAEDVWAKLPRVPPIDVPGAVVFVPPGNGIRLNETIEGKTYIGQRYELWIYPQRRGKLQIPSVNLDVQMKAFGLNAETESKSVRTEALSVDVAYPEGVSSSAGVICVNGFSAQQSWRPENADFRVGDGVTRTITRTVEGAPAMLLAPLRFSDISGAGAYRKQPQVEDEFDRGSLTGTRTESVTFVFEEAGQIELPKLQVTWWDLRSGQLRSEELEGRSFQVAAAAEVESESPLSAGGSPKPSWRRILIIGLTVGILGLLWWYRQPLKAWYHRCLMKYRSTEQAHFRVFKAAAKSGRSRETLRSLVRWWDVADANSRAPRLDDFAGQYGSEELLRQIASLEAAVDSQNDTWHPGDFARQVGLARTAFQSSMRSQKASQESCLPPLY